MPIVWPPESPYVIEMEKWNTPKRAGGHNANGYEPYPRMLYLAVKHPTKGQYMVGDYIGMQSLDMSLVAQAEAFTRGCQMTVGNEQEELNAKSRGWRNSPADALALAEKQERAVGDAAAEEQWRLKNRHGELARREFEAADRATDAHLPTLPEAPRRRGRKPKAESVPA